MSKFNKYEEFVAKVSSGKIVDTRLSTDKNLLHKLLGLQEEVGEITQLFSKEMLYNRPIKREDLISELGDAMHYFTAFANMNGITLSEITRHNKDKLTKKDPELFGDNENE